MPTPYSDVAHLLRRAGFGGLPDEISALAQYDLPQVVDRVLDRSNVPPVLPPAVVLDRSAPWNDRYVTFIYWWFDRMKSTPAALAEKMTVFWHGHFTSSLEKTDFINMWNQLQLFRDTGMGSFRTLAQAVAISPAMLEWLDNANNVAGGPNENFAREMMELFTLGVNQYTQADVVAAARAWTGHGLPHDSNTYGFTPSWHDEGTKTFFGISKNWNGPDVIDEICYGAKQRTMAMFIVDKFWTYFAGSNGSTLALNAIADAFIASNLDITSLLRAMFLRPEFYADAARHEHIRNPVEFLVAAMRYTGLASNKMHPEWYLDAMGQLLLVPPNVAGWKTGRYWISNASMWARINAARNTSWTALEVGLLAGTKNVSIQTAAQRAIDAFGIDRPSASTRSVLESVAYAERYAQGWAEQPNLITTGLLAPEFQVG